MNGFFLNVILALAWGALNGDFAPRTLLVGFVIGFIILLFSQRIVGAPTYAYKAWRILDLLMFLLVDLVISNQRVARDVLKPRLTMQSGVIGVPLDAKTDHEITLLSTLVMLTPGTIALDVSSDRQTLYVHVMNLDDPDKARRQIKDGFERRVLEVLR